MRLSENRLRTNQRIINVWVGWGICCLWGCICAGCVSGAAFYDSGSAAGGGPVPDTGAQDSQQASVEETEQGSEEKEETQAPEERQPMTLDDYQQIQTELYAIGNTANKSIVTITGGGQ